MKSKAFGFTHADTHTHATRQAAVMDVSVTAAWKLVHLCFVSLPPHQSREHCRQLSNLGMLVVHAPEKQKLFLISARMLKTTSVRHVCQGCQILHRDLGSAIYIYLAPQRFQERDWQRCTHWRAAELLGGRDAAIIVHATCAHSVMPLLQLPVV